jgi:SagB-type dehydrogenase family enzyme
MYVNPFLFFLIKDGELIAWDYKNHQQYEIEKDYLERLLAWAKNPHLEKIPMDQELEEGGLLLSSPPSSMEWGWDVLSQIFHVGTQNIAEELSTLEAPQWIENYLQYCESISQEAPKLLLKREGKKVALPFPDITLLDQETLVNALKNRKTCRSFQGKPLDLSSLSTLLYLSFGCIHGEWKDLNDNELETLGVRKAFPSAGGLHPEEVYLLALRVKGLEAGVYHYDPQDHHLTLIQLGDFEERLIQLLYGQYFAKGLSIGVFLTARFEKSWWKYRHSRGYRTVLFDIGHASQTFLLTATALKLNTWLTAAFSDSQLEDFLKIPSSSESPLFFVGAGYGDNQSFDPLILKNLKG